MHAPEALLGSHYTHGRGISPCLTQHKPSLGAEKCEHVTPMMRLYLPRVEARLRGITALWCCRKKGHLHTIPCNEQEWDNESWLTIATSHST